jgi:protein-tyrosine kinase
MSLVEQTIARLKRDQGPQAGNDAAGRKPGEPGGAASVEEPVLSNATLTIDESALREAGYRPEAECEREFAEQYRRIKRPLIDKALSSGAGAQARIIVVTSALPGDGKTFTSLNLALSLSLERDVSVLLIDADVAKRHISHIFGLEKSPGLLDVLADERQEVESVMIPTSNPRLTILPAGSPVAHTAELLSSHRMGTIITHLSTRISRRIVLVDSPPLLMTNEGRALVKLAGQVVLVVRAGHTPRQAVQAAMASIDLNQAGGVVLNQVPVAAMGGYYGYGYYGASEAPT